MSPCSDFIMISQGKDYTMSIHTAMHYIDLIMTGDFPTGVKHQQYRISGKLFKKMIVLMQNDKTVKKFEKYTPYEQRRSNDGNSKT